MLRRIWLALFLSLLVNPSAFAEWYEPIYNDTYYEVVDQKAQTRNYMRSYDTWDGYRRTWIRHTVTLRRDPLPKPAPPPAAVVTRPAPAAPVPTPIVKELPKEETKLPEKKLPLPVRTFKDDVAPPLIDLEPDETVLPKAFSVPAPPLTKIAPPSLEKVTWVTEGKQLSEAEHDELVNGVRDLSKSTTAWQNDFLDRFSNCATGFCMAKKNGTFEKLPMPFQIPMGQVRLLKLETEYLAYLLKQEEKPSPKTMAQALRVVRRAEALRPLLESTAVVKARPYVTGMEDSLKVLQNVSKNWNYFSTSESKGWVLRWQLLAIDMEVWQENLEYMSRTIKGEARDRLDKVASEIGKAAKQIGAAPWELPMNEQSQIARNIYRQVSLLYHDYPELSAKSEKSSREADSYLGIIAFLGANENVRYLAYNVVLSIDGEY